MFLTESLNLTEIVFFTNPVYFLDVAFFVIGKDVEEEDNGEGEHEEEEGELVVVIDDETEGDECVDEGLSIFDVGLLVLLSRDNKGGNFILDAEEEEEEEGSCRIAFFLDNIG